MNLANRDCFRAVSAGVQTLLDRYDWDGVNLAELYFESLEGAANPARFTPMNADVRAEFKTLHGRDPIDCFSSRDFLDYRVALARRIEEEWLAELELARKRKPDLDIVLTHVDDRFDTSIRDAIGADAANVLPFISAKNVSLLIEDPATVWHLGPARYRTIAEAYRALTTRTDRLAIDLNIVDRYQDVYPTKQQTGVELFQLVHHAAASFQRVALYFENSLLEPDLRLLPASAAAVTRFESTGTKTFVDSPAGFGLPWQGAANVDGVPWPIRDAKTLWLPSGPHAIDSARETAAPKVLRLTADLRSARTRSSTTIEFSYQSSSRAIAILDRPPKSIEIDGVAQSVPAGAVLMLPRGQHVVVVMALELR